MLDTFLVILVHAAAEGGLRDDFTNILENKFIRLEVGVGAKAISLLLRLDDRDIGVVLLLKALILACGSTPAISGTFHLGGAIDTVRIFTAGMIALGDRIYRTWSVKCNQ